jgi:hypothetical protein
MVLLQASAPPYGLPFTVEQFYGVFVQYNEAVWPMQIVLYAIAMAIVALLAWGASARDRIISGL